MSIRTQLFVTDLLFNAATPTHAQTVAIIKFRRLFIFDDEQRSQSGAKEQQGRGFWSPPRLRSA